MELYTVKELIPASPYHEKSGDLYSFYHWWYNIEYIHCDIKPISRDKVVNSIKLLRMLYDITLTEEEIISKNLIRIGDTIRTIMKNKEDVLTLINYDRRILDRIACIYNRDISTIVLDLFSRINLNYNTYFLYYHNNYINKYMIIYKPSSEEDIPYYVGSLDITLCVSMGDLPSQIKELNIRNVSNTPIEIPTSVISINVIFLDDFTLHNDIRYISCEGFTNRQVLPKNLVYFKCDFIPIGYKFSDTLKALDAVKIVLDAESIPKDIEYIRCKSIINVDKKIFNKCKYLNITDNSKYLNAFKSINLSNNFPNLECIECACIPSNYNELKKPEVLFVGGRRSK